MPTPYHEIFGYLGVTAAMGSAATPSQQAANALIKTQYASNGSPATLTGTFATLALISPPAPFAAGQKIVLVVAVSADVTPGSSGQLVVQVIEDGSPVAGPVTNSIPADGTGASCAFTIELSPIAGTHVFAVQAKGTGDATFTVAAHNGAIQGSVVSV